MEQSKEKESLQDYFNIVMVGDGDVGKTSILNRYCNNKFTSSKKKKTKSLDIYKKSLEYKGNEFMLKLWDTKYSESSFKPNKQIYERADCIIFVCSITDKDSFENINYWYQILSDNIDLSNKQMMILANKADLEDDRVVGNDEIRQKSEELDIPFYEVSSLNNTGLDEAFNALISKVVTNTYKGETQVLKADENNNSSGNCAN